MLPIVIIAGGLATRLRPVTETIPKSLIDINGEPFVSHQLHLLRENGIKEVVMCLGYLGEKIVDFVGNGHQFNLHVQYVFDGEKLLGTAGAIKKALSLLSENFFVINGDSYLPCDYLAIQNAFFKLNKKALMTVFRNENVGDMSNVEYVDGVIVNYDKQNRNDRMKYIDYGLEVFSQKAFEDLSDNQVCDLSVIYQKLIRESQLAACEVKQKFYENGSFSGIADLESYLQIESV